MDTRTWEEGAESTWQHGQASRCEQTGQASSGPPWKRTGVSFMPPRRSVESAANRSTCRSDIRIRCLQRSITSSPLQKAGTHQRWRIFSLLIVGVTDKKVISFSRSSKSEKKQRSRTEIFRCITTGSITRLRLCRTHRGGSLPGALGSALHPAVLHGFSRARFFRKGEKGVNLPMERAREENRVVF